MHRKGIFITALAVIIAFGAAEAAVRMASPTLREPLVWGTWEVQNKVDAMNRLGKAGGRTPAVFIGSSMINGAVDPALATRLLGIGRPVFNAGLNASDLASMERWTLDVVVPRLRPRLVVIGFNSGEWNDNGITRFNDLFLESQAIQRIERRGNLFDRAEWWLEDASALVRFRTVLRAPISAIRGGEREKRAAGVSRLGRLRALEIFQKRPYSVMPLLDRRFREQKLHDYSAGGPEMAALDRLVRGLTARKIKVLLVRMPVVRKDVIALHPGKEADYAKFEQALAGFLATHSVPYVDMAARFDDPALFVDPLHMNLAGMKRFTEAMTPIVRQVLGTPRG